MISQIQKQVFIFILYLIANKVLNLVNGCILFTVLNKASHGIVAV